MGEDTDGLRRAVMAALERQWEKLTVDLRSVSTVSTIPSRPSLTLDDLREMRRKIEPVEPSPTFLCSTDWRGDMIRGQSPGYRGATVPGDELDVIFCHPDHIRAMLDAGAEFDLVRVISRSSAEYRLACGLFDRRAPALPLPPFRTIPPE